MHIYVKVNEANAIKCDIKLSFGKVFSCECKFRARKFRSKTANARQFSFAKTTFYNANYNFNGTNCVIKSINTNRILSLYSHRRCDHSSAIHLSSWRGERKSLRDDSVLLVLNGKINLKSTCHGYSHLNCSIIAEYYSNLISNLVQLDPLNSLLLMMTSPKLLMSFRR